jgi:mRNA-degrading endonuclease RelE of RelBE toxin-antitoxin system
VYGYAFTHSAAKDLYAFRHNPKILILLSTSIIPAVLPDPRRAGDQKHGDLSGVYAVAFREGRTAYRLVYTVDDTRHLVEFIAFGPHDTAYANARRRL